MGWPSLLMIPGSYWGLELRGGGRPGMNDMGGLGLAGPNLANRTFVGMINNEKGLPRADATGPGLPRFSWWGKVYDGGYMLYALPTS